MTRHPPKSTLFPYPPLFRSSIPVTLCAFRTLSPFLSSVLMKRGSVRSEEHTSELQSQFHLLFPLLFFLNDPAPPEIYPLPLPAPLPIFNSRDALRFPDTEPLFIKRFDEKGLS